MYIRLIRNVSYLCIKVYIPLLFVYEPNWTIISNLVCYLSIHNLYESCYISGHLLIKLSDYRALYHLFGNGSANSVPLDILYC